MTDSYNRSLGLYPRPPEPAVIDPSLLLASRVFRAIMLGAAAVERAYLSALRERDLPLLWAEDDSKQERARAIRTLWALRGHHPSLAHDERARALLAAGGGTSLSTRLRRTPWELLPRAYKTTDQLYADTARRLATELRYVPPAGALTTLEGAFDPDAVYLL